MDGKEKISVVIAAYHGERYIGELLASLVAQNRRPDEVIICDDSDNWLTAQAAVEFRHRLNIRYECNNQRLGVCRNFQKAIEMASCRWIFLADQDDVWLPEKIELMAKELAPGKAVFCDSIITDQDLNISNLSHFENRGMGFLSDLPTGHVANQQEIFLKRVPPAGHDMAFDADLRSLFLPFPDLPKSHDTWMGIMGAMAEKWSIVPRPLTLFRQHGQNVSGSGRRMGILRQLAEADRSVRHDTFGWNARLLQAASERLTEQGFNIPDSMGERIAHSQARSLLHRSFFKRYPLICQEYRNGNYFRFARGWKSIIQDVFL